MPSNFDASFRNSTVLSGSGRARRVSEAFTSSQYRRESDDRISCKKTCTYNIRITYRIPMSILYIVLYVMQLLMHPTLHSFLPLPRSDRKVYHGPTPDRPCRTRTRTARLSPHRYSRMVPGRTTGFRRIDRRRSPA